MIPPLRRPKRKNPLLRTRLPLLPPGPRSRAALGLTAWAALGRFKLQTCRTCGRVQYPPREACHECLGVHLQWRSQDGSGELIAETTIHHSHDPYFRERVPWRLGMVRLDAGPCVVAHMHAACGAAPSRVRAGRGWARRQRDFPGTPHRVSEPGKADIARCAECRPARRVP